MKKIAILLTGHIRSFYECYDNINIQLLSPLRNMGYEIHFYLSLWNTVGHRSQNWTGTADFNGIINILNPVNMNIEQFNRDYFLQNFNTDKWLNYSHLSNHTTFPDSVSMWYKVQQGLNMIEDYQRRNGFVYDCIVRARPDVLYDDNFSSELPTIIEEIIMNDVVYIPKWHGKWREISMTISDFFAIGNYNVMRKYMSVYNNLGELVTKDIPHTGEGLLYGQIQDNVIKRFSSGFSIHRGTHIDRIV